MSSNQNWQGIPVTGPPNSPMIMVPENIPHYYDANGNLQVVSISPDSQGVWPPTPPKQYQAPTYSESKPVNTTEPQCKFDSSGTCTQAGFTPGGVWYNVGDKSEHPSGISPGVATGISLIRSGLALVQKG